MHERLTRAAAVTVLALLIPLSAGAQSLVSRYVAGDDYQVASQPGAARSNGQIRVTEFFLYSCPHCYHFESKLNAWRKHHSDIAFSRVPVLFGPGGQPYARLYYAEVKLGVIDRLHDQVFDAIHQQGNRLTTEAGMRQFMVAHGVDGQRFATVYDSSWVKDQVRQIVDRMQRYRVTAVPSISVAGRYWISGRSAGSNERMLEVADYLIDRSRNGNAAAGDTP